MAGQVDPVPAREATRTDLHNTVAGDSDGDIVLDTSAVGARPEYGRALQHDIDNTIVRCGPSAASVARRREGTMGQDARTRPAESEVAQGLSTVHRRTTPAQLV